MSSWSFWRHPLWLAYAAEYGFGDKQRPDDDSMHLLLLLGHPDDMFARMSKGHRSDIKYASVAYVEEWNAFDHYQRMHKQAFPKARSQRTYDIQRQMCDDGIAFAVCAWADHHTVSAALFFESGDGAYYASAVRCEHSHRGSAAFLVWRAMLYLARRKVEWLDLGPLPRDDASDKERQVADFKRHFGAEVPPEVEIGDFFNYFGWR